MSSSERPIGAAKRQTIRYRGLVPTPPSPTHTCCARAPGALVYRPSVRRTFLLLCHCEGAIVSWAGPACLWGGGITRRDALEGGGGGITRRDALEGGGGHYTQGCLGRGGGHYTQGCLGRGGGGITRRDALEGGGGITRRDALEGGGALHAGMPWKGGGALHAGMPWKGGGALHAGMPWKGGGGALHAGMPWKGGGTPPPPSFRPARQPPSTADLMASEAASEDPSFLMHP